MLALPIGALALAAAAPARAQSFVFFEGDNCTQSRVATIKNDWIKDRYTHELPNAFKGSRGKNDEARSMRVLPVAGIAGGEIALYDSSDLKDNKDDMIRYRVTSSELPAAGVCVPSFNRAFKGSGIETVERRWRDGLAGKVSRAAMSRYYPRTGGE